MALLFFLVIFLIHHNAHSQPSPGYYPSSKIYPSTFYSLYNNEWGPQHQNVSQDQSSLTIWLDKYSGGGFKSKNPYRNGYFGVSVKLQSGYTAGTNTAFFLSNNEAHPGFHDEVDIEFLGTIPGEHKLVLGSGDVRGSGDGDGTLIGREVQFHLWFDPTADYHNYGILWNPDQIVFFVDDIPVRRYPRKSDAIFPLRPMWVYGSIWDASAWATDHGKYKVDYKYQPFVAKMTTFKIGGCSAYASARCQPIASSPAGTGLSPQQYAAMQWAQNYYMVYNYCSDPGKDHSLTPEC